MATTSTAPTGMTLGEDQKTDGVVFKDLSADDLEQVPMHIESLCMNCHENGITKLMCTRIPFYKQVILMSFACEHCGFQNNELQSGEPVQEFGTEIMLKVQEMTDLNRSVIKSEYASIEIPELELAVPNNSQPGEITTVEGVLSRVQAGLEQDQERRRADDPETAAKIDVFLQRVNKCMTLETPWTLKLNDPTGNCFVQNPNPMHVDPRCITSHYFRRLEQNKLLGLADDNDAEEPEEVLQDREWKSYEDAKSEVLHFQMECPGCAAPTETLMKPTDIPYFKTVIVMSTTCDRCGYKSNEIKSGGAVQENGCKLSVRIEEPIDMARDVLKSDTCGLELPELEVEVGQGALSSRFTTIEGLLTATRDQLKEQSSFFFGDSADQGEHSKFAQLFAKFDEVLALKRPCTVVMDDPAGNSYIQSLNAPMDDSRLLKEFYTRSYEQNDDLGINDMKVENYEAMDTIAEEADEEGGEDGGSAAKIPKLG